MNNQEKMLYAKLENKQQTSNIALSLIFEGAPATITTLIHLFENSETNMRQNKQKQTN